MGSPHPGKSTGKIRYFEIFWTDFSSKNACAQPHLHAHMNLPDGKEYVKSVNGKAFICYIPIAENKYAFQGHLVDADSRACYGLMATRKSMTITRKPS